MKIFVRIILLAFCVSTITGCTILNVFAMLGAGSTINKTVLSEENENFQEITGIELIHVKRGLWSMQNEHRNKMMKHYYESLLDNKIVYTVDNSQNEFAKQVVNDDVISISINSDFLQDFTQLEKAIMLIASTSTLALLKDVNYNKNIEFIFFKCIEGYTPENKNITDSLWFRSRSVSISNDSVIIK